MADKEGWFERMAREQSEARTQGAIRELQRRIDAGEFPDNEDTVKAFSAGWFSVYEFKADTEQRNQAGSTSHLGSVLSALLGLLGISLVGILLVEHAALNDRAPYIPFVGLLLLGLAIFLARRARRQERAGVAAFATKWGKP